MRLRTCAVAALAVAGLVVAGAPANATSSGHAARHSTSHVAHYGHGLTLPAHRHAVKSKHVPQAGTPKTVASDLAGPLTFAVGANALYVGQAFAGIVSKIPAKGAAKVVGTAAAGADVAGVELTPGALTWTERAGDQGPAVTASLLHRQTRDGVTTVDLLAAEKAANPDQVNTYGFTDLTPECEALVPAMFKSYTGVADSHAYGTLAAGRSTYVADAGANALLKVSKSGKVSTVAVFKPIPVAATAEAAAGLGLPDCVVGHKYGFEPVPTDVERGRDGWLYVTLLPGGPEDGSLGANGKVVKVNPRTGKVVTVAKGLAGATGLAVGPKGTIYVAQMNANEVSSIDRHGKVHKLLTVTQPAGVEWAKGKLWFSSDVFGAGKVSSVRVHR
ncbi:MAG: ScyD/ScyE family protein [Brevundimonas sp.]